MNRVLRLLLSTKILLPVAALIVLQSSAPHLMAIPAFARKYRTACATCHNNWPELNDFGRAFKINGFKFPKDDEQFVKDPPLLLGAQAQKESFPNSIYPGELPILPIAFRYSGYFSHTSAQPAALTAANGYIPPTDLFAPNTVTLLAAAALALRSHSGSTTIFRRAVRARMAAWETATSKPIICCTSSKFPKTISMFATVNMSSIFPLPRPGRSTLPITQSTTRPPT